MMYDWALARRIRCSKQDQWDCLQLVSEILMLAKKARALGLLSLMETVETCPRPFLKKGLQLVVDGERPQTMRNILEITILAGGFRGKELLERCMILEGLMAIQAGLNPHSIKELVLAFLGDELSLAYDAQFESGKGADWESLVKTMPPVQPSFSAPSTLNRLFDGLSDGSIQECLREINMNDLAKTFKQMIPKNQKRIFSVLPNRAAAFLREIIEQTGPVPPSELTEAQERVEAVLRDLGNRPASSAKWAV